MEQSNQGSSSYPDTILKKPKRVIKKPVRLIEEMEGRKFCVEELIGYALRVADEVKSFEYGELVKVPKEKKLVECNWILKKKERSSEIEEVCFKARLVAKGLSQVEALILWTYFLQWFDILLHVCYNSPG